ncbi:MAG: response regulator transcription factor [Novosphingobium sp.]|jgi:DNA-binding NarL/FixJ family response regulator|nr:response regulator transcription factor [Novosphingobium sp.]
MIVDAMALMLAQRWPDLVVDKATDCPGALTQCTVGPDLILADLGMPGAEPGEGIAALRRSAPSVPIIVFTGMADDEVLLRLLALPVGGFIAKTEPPSLVLAAIELVLAGGRHFPARIAELALRRSGYNPAGSETRITARHQQVLRLLAAGRSNKEIAIALALSPATVETHVAQSMAAVGAAHRAESASRAINLGLI